MGFELWQAGLLVAVGIAAGFLNVMAGGGSLLTVPVMVFMGLPGPVANGTNRIAILAQNITAIATFARRGFKDFRLSLTLAACSLPGAIAGALLGVQFHGVWFNRALALIMVGVMLVMYFDKRTSQDSETYQPTGRQLLTWPLTDGRSRLLGRLYSAWCRLYNYACSKSSDGPRSCQNKHAQGLYRCRLHDCCSSNICQSSRASLDDRHRPCSGKFDRWVFGHPFRH